MGLAAQLYQQHCANKSRNNFKSAMPAGKITFPRAQVFHNHPGQLLAGLRSFIFAA
jgi:hypothetical protein